MYLGHNAGEILLHQVGHHVGVGQHLLLHALALSLLAEDARVLQPPLPSFLPMRAGVLPADTAPCLVLSKGTFSCCDLEFCISPLGHTASRCEAVLDALDPLQFTTPSRTGHFH